MDSEGNGRLLRRPPSNIRRLETKRMSEKSQVHLFNKRFSRTFIFSAALTIIIMSLVFSGIPVLADPANPDSAPTITNVHINTYVAESGDMMITGIYNIPYATLPTPTADQTFIINLISTVNGSILGSTLPFDYASFKNGYNEGVFSLYFSAATVTSEGITWGANYIIQIAENPTQFTTPVTWNYAITSDVYTTFITQELNQADLASQVFVVGSIVGNYYKTSLFNNSGTNGATLNASGEAYFRGAIPGLQDLAPGLFIIQTGNTDVSNTEWSTAAFDAYTSQFDGTWVGTAIAATGDQFGMSGNMAMGIFFIVPLCLGCLIFSGIKFHTTDPGLISAAILLEMGAIMGWVTAPLFATIFQLMGIYVGYLLFFSRG